MRRSSLLCSTRVAVGLAALALVAAPAAYAQLPGGGSGSLGEEEHQENSGPEANLTREIDGVRPDRGTTVPANARVYVASRAPNVDVTVESKGVVSEIEPRPLVDGCVACVYEIPLPEPPPTGDGGDAEVWVFTDRNEERYSYVLSATPDHEAPVIADAPSLTFRRDTRYDLLGQPILDSVTVQASVRPPDNDEGVTALVAYAGRPGEALLPAAARLWTPGCHPCTIDIANPPGIDLLGGEGETCIRVVAIDWAGNQGDATHPTCLEVPEPSPGIPLLSCEQTDAPSLGGLALALGALLVRRRRRSFLRSFLRSPD
jgi:MYXO-CTERM domain-containing protein